MKHDLNMYLISYTCLGLKRREHTDATMKARLAYAAPKSHPWCFKFKLGSQETLTSFAAKMHKLGLNKNKKNDSTKSIQPDFSDILLNPKRGTRNNLTDREPSVVGKDGARASKK